MVVCGDFLQVRRLSELPLPFPLCLRLIPTFSTFSQLPPVMENNADAVFAFESESWNKVISKSVNLTTVSVPFPLSSSLRDLTSVSFSDFSFRQKDQRFVDMLNEMRYGNPSWSTTQTFNRLTKEVVYEDGLEPTVCLCLLPSRLFSPADSLDPFRLVGAVCAESAG